MSTKTLVAQAVREMFQGLDPTAVDRYVAADYRQHSALAEDGPEGLRELVASLPEDFAYQPVRMLADGDLALLHGVYHGLGPEPMVAFDLYRVADGRLAEHWDALTPLATTSVSGRTQVDGPTGVSHPEQTETSRAVVTSFLHTVMIAGAYDKLPEFVDGEDYAQHSPGIGDGLSGLGTALAALHGQGASMEYDRVHRVVAEGEFAFAQSEGRFAGTPYAYHDLFRVAGGRIVEHWDVMTEVPAALPHGNGLF